MGGAPSVLCLTPVRNEAPRLPTFLAAAATWADGIIIADQGSDDGSRDIARAHPKVVFVDNPGTTLDEASRQQLLVGAARAEFPGDRVLLLVDADEALTAGAREHADWQAMVGAEPGTAIRMPWIHPLPDGHRAWIQPRPKRFGLVDDGRPPTTRHMHSHRLPAARTAPVVLHATGVVHFQFMDWESLKAKQRWYEVWHRLHHADERAARIFRRYHWMDALPADEIVAWDREWWRGYQEAGIDFTAMGCAGDPFRWDTMTLELIVRHGAGRFRRHDLWDHDWSAAARELGCGVPEDPRRLTDRWALRALAATQGSNHRLRRDLLERSLRFAGW